jgi:chorismate dehydratase
VKKIRIGASDHLAIRPLLVGLAEHAPKGVELVYEEPGPLTLALERGDLDAALIPSIEYLRGVGAFALRGPALVAREGTMGLVLVSEKPFRDIKRVAVEEFSGTPLVALRVVLDKLHGILPDLCIFKRRPLGTSNWRDEFDAALLMDDDALSYVRGEARPSETCHDVGDMWRSVFSKPLVISVWAYNDPRLGHSIESLLVSSRDRGVENVHALSKSLAEASPYDESFLRKYFSLAWSYDLGTGEEEELRTLEDAACEYELLQTRRLEKVATT